MTATVGSFTTAGFAGSAQMNALGAQMERLSRGIAGIFVPEMNKVIGLVGQAADWFQSLTAAQQDNIKRWIEAAAVGLGVAIILPKVFAGLTLVAGGLKAVAAGVAILEGSTGIGALLPLLGGIITAFVAIGAASEVGRGGLGRLYQMVQPLLDGFAKIADMGMKAFEPFLDLAGNAFEGIMMGFNAMMPAITQVANALTAAFSKIAVALKPVQELFIRMMLAGVQALQPLIPLVTKLIDFFGNQFVRVIQVVEVALRGMMKGLEQVVLAAGTAAAVIAKMAGDEKGAMQIMFQTAQVLAALRTPIKFPKPENVPEHPRTEVMPGKTGSEAVTATLGRLQQAALQKDYQSGIFKATTGTEKNTGVMVALLKQFLGMEQPAVVSA